jgi:hypothetical protein
MLCGKLVDMVNNEKQKKNIKLTSQSYRYLFFHLFWKKNLNNIFRNGVLENTFAVFG